VAKPSPVAQLVSPVFNKNLTAGERSADVQRLQVLLSQDKEVYPEGIVSGYYGPKTVEAARRFQAKYGLPQVGVVGPATRAKLQEVFGKGGIPIPAPAPAPAPTPAPASSSEEDAIRAQIKAIEEQLKKLKGQ